MVITKGCKQITLNDVDEQSLKLILNFYEQEISDNWDDSLNESSVIMRIKDLIGN